MASGESVVQIIDISPPGTLYATVDIRPGGSTPAESVQVADFDDGTIEYRDYKCILQGYDGGGLTFKLPWSASSATANAIVWEIGIRRVQDDGEDIDSSHTYIYNAVVDTAPSASGEISVPEITFTNGADMDNWAEGEIAIVRVRRNTGSGSDNMTGDAELWGLIPRET